MLSAFALLGLGGAAGCATDATTAPRTVKERPTDSVITPRPAYPPLARAGSAYNRLTPSASPGFSRYVLYRDSTFSLQYSRPDFGFFEFPGRYSRTNDVIEFRFNGDAYWGATGILDGVSLTVRVNAHMGMADFEDGVYGYAGTCEQSIYLVDFGFDLDGAPSVTRLTAGADPAWSPEGDLIAFHRDGRVRVIDPDGSGELDLAAGWSPTWSPDGRRIAFVNHSGIAVMNADGTGVTTLLRHDFRTDTYAPSDKGIGDPSWSPLGLLIAFEHYGDLETSPGLIFVMNADGSNPRRVTTSQNVTGAESDPSWSPNGSEILFRSTQHAIATVAASGGTPRSISTGLHAASFASDPVWQPWAMAISFTSMASGSPAIWTMSDTGTNAHEMMAHGSQPAFSPAGFIMAFVSEYELMPCTHR